MQFISWLKVNNAPYHLREAAQIPHHRYGIWKLLDGMASKHQDRVRQFRQKLVAVVQVEIKVPHIQSQMFSQCYGIM